MTTFGNFQREENCLQWKKSRLYLVPEDNINEYKTDSRKILL